MASTCLNMPALVVTSYLRESGAHASGKAIDLGSAEFQPRGKLFFYSALYRYFSIAQDLIFRMQSGKLLVDLTISKEGKLLNPHFHLDLRAPQAEFGWELLNTATGQRQSGLFETRGAALAAIEKTYKNAARRTSLVVPELCIFTTRPKISFPANVPSSFQKEIYDKIITEQKTDWKFPQLPQLPDASAIILLFLLFMLSKKK